MINKCKTLLVGILLSTTFLSCSEKQQEATDPNESSHSQTPFFKKQILFDANEDSTYYTFRIASMVATTEGTLLAFCAARKNQGGDWDPIDIVMRRSTDLGETWEPYRIVAGGGNIPYDNAMPIVDEQTGDIHLLFQSNYNKLFYTKSSDDGISFEEPIDITKVVESYRDFYDWVVMAPGPGHGVQTENGRLVVPFWLSDGSAKEFGPDHRGHRPSIVVSVYSDDHGQKWQAGDVVVHDTDSTVVPNETSCIVLADGTVMFNSRNESPVYRRLISISKNGATDWSVPRYEDAFFEPICFGSMVRVSKKPESSKNRILFCNPDSRHRPLRPVKQGHTEYAARGQKRENLTMRMSYDEGKTWPVKKVLDPGIAGYSDLAVTPDGTIHCFYEGGTLTGSHTKNAWMAILSFNVAWLTDEQDNGE